MLGFIDLKWPRVARRSKFQRRSCISRPQYRYRYLIIPFSLTDDSDSDASDILLDLSQCAPTAAPVPQVEYSTWQCCYNTKSIFFRIHVLVIDIL